MRRPFFAAISLALAACSHPQPPVTSPAPAAQVPSVTPISPAVRSQQLPPLNEALPPMPEVTGPLAIKVVYPPEGAALTARDSQYMSGSVGNGAASHTINGQEATVYPNGSFMAWLRTPPASAPKYDLVAIAGNDTARYTHNLRVPTPASALPTEGKLIVDSTEFAPRANNTLFLRDDERTTVRIRIPSNATAALVTPTARIPLDRSGEIASRTFNAADLRAGGTIVVTRGDDTVRVPITALRGPRADAP
jgi:hypothetical protein